METQAEEIKENKDPHSIHAQKKGEIRQNAKKNTKGKVERFLRFIFYLLLLSPLYVRDVLLN